MRALSLAVVLSLPLAWIAPATADTLLIDSMRQAPDTQRPTRGMTMTQVEDQFGAPLNKVPAVGEPPISRWEYGDFIVYFEHNLVLHSVVKHAR
jgi:hypothetical protein